MKGSEWTRVHHTEVEQAHEQIGWLINQNLIPAHSDVSPTLERIATDTPDDRLQAHNSVVVGVDGGRSKTIALIANAHGQILGAGRSGDATHSTEDATRRNAYALEAVREAIVDAKVASSQIAVGSFGLSGVDWPEDHDDLVARLSDLGVGEHILVRNDALLGWRAALTNKPFGVVIAAGTAANIGVVTPTGQEWHFGAYARSGGAMSVAREALSAVYRSKDGRGESTVLSDVVLKTLGYPSVDALLRAENQGRLLVPRVFGLAPYVLEVAFDGDEVAIGIIVEQAKVLAEYAQAAIRRFSLESEDFDVVLSGGLFRSRNKLLEDTVAHEVQKVAPRTRFVHPTFEPAIGALLYAYDRLGLVVTPEIKSNLTNTAPSTAFFDTRNDETAPTLEDHT